METKSKKKTICISLPLETVEQLNSLASSTHRTKSAVIQIAIEQLVKQNEQKKI